MHFAEYFFSTSLNDWSEILTLKLHSQSLCTEQTLQVHSQKTIVAGISIEMEQISSWFLQISRNKIPGVFELMRQNFPYYIATNLAIF